MIEQRLGRGGEERINDWTLGDIMRSGNCALYATWTIKVETIQPSSVLQKVVIDRYHREILG